MSLEHSKKVKIFTLGDWSGGVNKNDPQASLEDNELYDCLNAVLDKKGIRRWCGCEGVTAKDAINDYLRGMYYSYEIDGTARLLGMWGGNCYEIDPSDGTISASLYATGGTGELWGGTQWGKFYGTDGTKVFKIEDGVGYQVGITPPASGASAAAAGGSLSTGVYKIKVAYARKVSGLNVLFSGGYDLGNVTLSGGNLSIAITGLANSTDPQVNNKVVFMTLAGGTTYYFFHETGNNTDTSFTISSDALYNNAMLYEQYLAPSGLPPAFTSLILFDNRIFGILGNILYYSLKATSGYDLERFPTLNKIEYPFQLNGLFGMGKTLCLNTVNDGIILQSVDDLGSRFEQYENRVSFRFMRSIVDWNGGKLGLTEDGLQFFDGQKFQSFDYSINIRPVIKSMYATADSNFQPCACLVSRNNRLEYHLSFCDTSLGSLNNNRTYVLNLSQTFYQDNLNYKTPWEIIDRGFNYSASSSTGQWFFGQSFENSSTIFKELTTHTTQQGIYDQSGVYLTLATNMNLALTGKIFCESLFTKYTFEDWALFFKMVEKATVYFVIADDPGKNLSQETDVSAYQDSKWDEMVWDEDLWGGGAWQRYSPETKQGIFGYSWFFQFIQTADDPDFGLRNCDIQLTVESGRGI
jgi:hypothetical protein